MIVVWPSMAIESPSSSPIKYETVTSNLSDGGSSSAEGKPSVACESESVVASIRHPTQSGDVEPREMDFRQQQSVHGPAPRDISNDELNILQTCLTRWRTEVEQDVKG